MKIFFILHKPALALMILIVASAALFAQTTMPERGICAHRGAMSSHPENTLSAFREAVRLGVQMIEFDVFMTADSQLVVIHDRTLDRTTNGSGRVSTHTLAEIKKLDAGSWKGAHFAGEHVPTLTEVLEIMPRNIWLNVHLKDSPEAGRRTALEIARQRRLHQAFLACDLSTKKIVQAAVPAMMVCNMERQTAVSDYVELTLSSQSHFIQFFKTPPAEAVTFAPRLHRRSIRINYCCTDDPSLLAELLLNGVNFVLVNDPAAAMQAVSEIGILPVTPEY